MRRRESRNWYEIEAALTRAFKALRKLGWLANKPGGKYFCCVGCASGEMAEKARKKGLDPETARAIYYTNQDKSNLREDGRLWLSHNGTAEEVREAISALRAEGLSVRWTGNTADRIQVTGLSSDNTAMDDVLHPWGATLDRVVREQFDKHLYVLEDPKTDERQSVRTHDCASHIVRRLHVLFFNLQTREGAIRPSDYGWLAESMLGEPETTDVFSGTRYVRWNVPATIAEWYTLCDAVKAPAQRDDNEQDWTFAYMS